MKIPILLLQRLLLAIGISGLPAAVYGNTVFSLQGDTIAKSLIYKNASSWYPCDQDGNDYIGGNNLVLHHVQFINDTLRGLVAEINHADTGYMEFTKSPISSEQFTLSTWFCWKSSYLESWQVVFEFADQTSINGVNNNFYLSVNAGTYYGAVAQSAAKGWESVSSTVLPPADQWMHLALTFDNSKVSLFFNGNQVGSGTMVHSMSDLQLNRFFLGCDPLPGRFWRAMDARFDDVAIFKKILSPAQIYALAHDTLPVSPKAMPLVFETEDYSHGNWIVNSQDTVTWVSYATPGGNIPKTNDPLLMGVICGEGNLNLWARVKCTDNLFHPLFTRVDGLSWIAPDTVYATADWTWIPLGSMNLPDGNHQVLLAAGNGNIQIDKLIATFDFEYNPNSDYRKTDVSSPEIPSNLTILSYGPSSATLRWRHSSDSAGVIAYDILDGQEVIAVTCDTSISLNLLSSTTYDFSVRAKDAAGNLSIQSPKVKLTTLPLFFSVDFNNRKQTIHHFGASDAWSVETIGDTWPLSKKEAIARYLFSNENDNDGNPMGIGLSMWRVNIGDGSADQENSGYDGSVWMRETQCYLNQDGQYDWDKQRGSQWFMHKAREYGVKSFTGWMNSPPYFLTRNGYTFRTTGMTGYNLDTSNYAEFADFLGTVAKHFQDQGVPFTQISPVNEPQYSWSANVGSASQAGSYCSNTEIANLVKSINNDFEQKGVDAKILIPEAGSLNYLYGNTSDLSTSNQVTSFWGKASSNYVGKLSHIANAVAGHAYWINGDVNSSITQRQNLLAKMKLVNPTLEYWETEFSLLEDAYAAERESLTPVDYSLWLSRIIHYDLTEANCTGWSFWTSLNYPAYPTHEYRFGLINWYPGGNSRATSTDGEFAPSKNLWVLGNYSRFIKPGFNRLTVSRSDGLTAAATASGQMASAYLSPRSDTLILVVINYSDNFQQFGITLGNVPDSAVFNTFHQYVTDAENDLKAFPDVSAFSPVLFRPRSITTLVGINANATNEISTKSENTCSVRMYPNPAASTVTIRLEKEDAMEVVLMDCAGRILDTLQSSTGSLNLDVNYLKSGFYLIKISYAGKNEIQKLTVIH